MQNQKVSHAISKIEGELHYKLLEDFSGQTEGLVQIGDEKFIMPAKYEKYADQIDNFEVRADDIWICTLPRSGTTWVQEMIWLICNDLDYETALSTPLNSRFPYLEFNTLLTDETRSKMKSILPEEKFEGFKNIFEPCYDRLSKVSSRRFIKTHLPMKIMPRGVMEVGAKCIYVARNPKDMCVSWFHMQKSFPGMAYTGDFESFSKYFMDDLTSYTPYWKHVLDGWQNRHLDNVHFMFYEECKADLATSLKKLSEFLGYPLKDEDLPKLMQHLSFENTKKNKFINYSLDPRVEAPNFIRRGMVGGNPEITPDISEKFDEWTKTNLAGVDFKFPDVL